LPDLFSIASTKDAAAEAPIELIANAPVKWTLLAPFEARVGDALRDPATAIRGCAQQPM
jgi:hypothetical protein